MQPAGRSSDRTRKKCTAELVIADTLDKEIYCLLAKLPLVRFSGKSVNNVKFVFKFCELWRQMKQFLA